MAHLFGNDAQENQPQINWAFYLVFILSLPFLAISFLLKDYSLAAQSITVLLLMVFLFFRKVAQMLTLVGNYYSYNLFKFITAVLGVFSRKQPISISDQLIYYVIGVLVNVILLIFLRFVKFKMPQVSQEPCNLEREAKNNQAEKQSLQKLNLVKRTQTNETYQLPAEVESESVRSMSRRRKKEGSRRRRNE